MHDVIQDGHHFGTVCYVYQVDQWKLIKLINGTYPLLRNIFISLFFPFFLFFSFLFIFFVGGGEGDGGGGEVRRVEMGRLKCKEMFWFEQGWVGRLLQRVL